MKYYKIIDGQSFVGIATNRELRKIQSNFGLLVSCSDKEAQFIQVDDKLYHATWMRLPSGNLGDDITTTDIIEINESEYNTLYEASEKGENIEIPNEDVNIEPTIEEVDNIYEATVEYIKEMKLSEISNICNQTITNGFDVVLSDNNTYHFSLTTQDQLNLITLSAMVASGETLIPYHADGELCRYYSAEDIITIMSTATMFKTYQVSYHNSLKSYVNSLDTIEEIGSVVYGMEIPEEYQSDVLKSLNTAKV